MLRLNKFVIAGLTTVLFSTAATAQVICGPRADITDRLAAEYREAPNALGVTNDGHMLEIYSSADGTWTILVTQPDSNPDGELRACLVAHGEGWQPLPPNLAYHFGDVM